LRWLWLMKPFLLRNVSLAAIGRWYWVPAISRQTEG
jgi:hypothetical protein